MTKFLSTLNSYFGADIRAGEQTLLESRVEHWKVELDAEDGETDEHWYAAIDDVIAQRERDAT